MHLMNPHTKPVFLAGVHYYTVDRFLLIYCIACGDFVFGPCFVMQYLVSILVLQSSR